MTRTSTNPGRLRGKSALGTIKLLPSFHIEVHYTRYRLKDHAGLVTASVTFAPFLERLEV
ncbi:hypothetical protein Daudx_0643 [Candidatus Desulforudis audaxviator]|nr:hypothetical protein Daudx_0643 [Candidatus Desulforudis audaxviator]